MCILREENFFCEISRTSSIRSTMAERVHLFTPPNLLHATPNLFHATPNSLHATPNLFHAILNTIENSQRSGQYYTKKVHVRQLMLIQVR